MALTLAVVFVVLYSNQAAAAEEAAAVETTCVLSPEKFAEIESIQNNFELDYLSRVKEELRVRKSLLHEVIDCATDELLVLRNNFDSIKITNEDAQALRGQLVSWFSETLNYYALQKAQIDNLGLQGTKDFAKNLRTWREGNFQPTASVAAQFIAWTRNQELFETGKNRLNQVRRAVDIFGLGLNEEVRNGLKDAEAEFQRTTSYNQRVIEILRAYGKADEAAEAGKIFLESLAQTYEKILSLAEKINEAIAQ